tara:strand:+ start:271 stop:510 length:240 start_codon:yes stop_codon:yes gene_type:complete
MKSIKNEYKILFYDFPNYHTYIKNGSNVRKVFIYADNDNQAMDIVMNTYNIPKNWIVSSSLAKKSVPVIIKNNNIYSYS